MLDIAPVVAVAAVAAVTDVGAVVRSSGERIVSALATGDIFFST